MNTDLAVRPVGARGYGHSALSQRWVEAQSDLDGASVAVTVFRSIIINQFYDPQVEFLELGVSVDSQTTLKLYGPDLNGVYGGMNGTGVFDAILPDPLGFWFTIADAQGNVLGYGRDSTSMVWNPSRPTGYGAIPGYRPPAFGPGISLGQSAVWRSRWLD